MLRGVITLEQRSETVSHDCGKVESLILPEKEDTSMMKTSSVLASSIRNECDGRYKVHRVNMILAVLHGLVFALAVVLHPPIEKCTVRSLP